MIEIENGMVVGAEKEWDEMHESVPLEEELAKTAFKSASVRISVAEWERLLRSEIDAQIMATRLLEEAEGLELVLEHLKQCDADALTMALRLLDETESMGPDTLEVMDRWRPRCEKLLRGE